MKESSEIYNFNRLYHDYKQRFTHFAKTYVGDWIVAEDIVMDSLMYYWENRSSLKNDSNIPAYILTVIKNKCLNFLQRERTREEAQKYLSNWQDWELTIRIATLEATNPEKLFSDEIQNLIDEALASLPNLSQDIFFRSRNEGQTNKEIADALGLSVKSVEYHITKTLKYLRKALKDYLPLCLFSHLWIHPPF